MRQSIRQKGSWAKQILFGEFGFVGCFLLAWGFLTEKKSLIQICIKNRKKRLRKIQKAVTDNAKESEGVRH